MKTGLMWYANGKQPFTDKVKDAAKRYYRKVGYKPDTCYCHVSARDGIEKVENIQLKFVKNIRPNYFWIGVNHGDND